MNSTTTADSGTSTTTTAAGTPSPADLSARRARASLLRRELAQDLLDAVDTLAGMAGEVADDALAGVAGLDTDGVGEVARQLAAIRVALNQVDARLAAQLIALHGSAARAQDGVAAVDGQRMRICYRHPQEDWDHAAVANAVVAAHLDTYADELAGANPDPYRVLAWLLPVVKVRHWRPGKLRRLGLDPDDYRTGARPAHIAVWLLHDDDPTTTTTDDLAEED